MHIWKAIFITLLLTGFFFAATNDLGILIPITAITVMVILALIYMLSHMLMIPMLDAWAKTEIREVIAGMVLAVVVYAMLFSVNNITTALTGENDYLGGAEKIVDKILKGYDQTYYDIIRAGTRIRSAATYSPYINVPLWYVSISYSTNPMGGIAPLFAPLSNATQGLANNVLIWEGVLLLVKLAHVSVQLVLLPLAFCIRMIPFTRKIGNTLIAICIGAMVLLPLSIYIVDWTHGVINYPTAKLSKSQLADLDFASASGGAAALMIAEPFCKIQVVRFILSLTEFGFAALVCLPLLFIYPVGPALFAACFNLVAYLIYPLFQVVFQVIYTLALLVFMFSGEGSNYASIAYDALYPFLRDVNNLILMGYIDTILIGLITISGIRSVSVALGGEWYLAGIQRLV